MRHSFVTSGRSVLSTWQGITGQVPTVEEWVAAVAGHDLFVYCGHGSGETPYPDKGPQWVYIEDVKVGGRGRTGS